MSLHEIPYEDLFDAIGEISYPADLTGHCEFCDAYIGYDENPNDDHYATCLWQRIQSLRIKQNEDSIYNTTHLHNDHFGARDRS